MCDKGHRYFKFDEASVVCRRCGEQKVVDVHALLAQLPAITYLPCPGPHYAPWQPNPWPPTFIWSSPNISIGGSSVSSGTIPNLTYDGGNS